MHESPCRTFPSQRCLVIPLIRQLTMNPDEQTSATHLVNDILARYNLQSTGEMIREVLQYSHEDGQQTQFCKILIPLKK